MIVRVTGEGREAQSKSETEQLPRRPAPAEPASTPACLGQGGQIGPEGRDQLSRC